MPVFGRNVVSDIAIAGIGRRFAGGIDAPESFWQFVAGEQHAVPEIPADRWGYRRYAHARRREPVARPPRHYGVLPLSARSAPAVRALAGRFADLLSAGADPGRLAEAAWTRLAHHPFRTGILLDDSGAMIRQLRHFASGAGRDATRTVTRGGAEPVFVFSGTGPQWWGMARDLLSADGAFADTAHVIDTEFRALAGWSIIEELLMRGELDAGVSSTEFAQAANFLVQVALVEELAEFGIRPAAVVGHGAGEVSAACVSGMLSLKDAVRVTHHRARAQATTAGSGGMLATGLTLDQALELVADDVAADIAAIDSGTALTLSGTADRLDAIAERLTGQGVPARRLPVDVPYHSALMNPILDDLRTALADLSPQRPRIPLYSTVTGATVAEADWDAEYWCANVRRPVRFADAVTSLIGAGSRVFLEVGAHPVLSGDIHQTLCDTGETGATVPTLDREQPDSASIRTTLAGLFSAGALDPAGFFPSDRRDTTTEREPSAYARNSPRPSGTRR
ncbi:hypothetical protein GCM10027088_38450 [Nocardia goodfellowii]